MPDPIKPYKRTAAASSVSLATQVNEVQTLTISGTGGTYTLSYNQSPTSNLAYNASAQTIQNALNALSSITATSSIGGVNEIQQIVIAGQPTSFKLNYGSNKTDLITNSITPSTTATNIKNALNASGILATGTTGSVSVSSLLSPSYVPITSAFGFIDGEYVTYSASNANLLFAAGQLVTVSGCSIPDYNVTGFVRSVTSTTFSIDVTGLATNANSTGGNVNAVIYNVTFNGGVMQYTDATLLVASDFSGGTSPSATITTITSGKSNVTVSGNSSPYSITFNKNLGYQDINLLITDNSNLTGGVATVVETTKAVNLISNNGRVYTITTASSNNFVQGQFVSISGGTDAFNPTNIAINRIINDKQFVVIAPNDAVYTGTPTTVTSSNYDQVLDYINLSNQFALSQPGIKDPVVFAKPVNKISSSLSGFIINQNLPYVTSVSNVATTLDQNALDQNNNPITYTTQNYIAQEFKLPSNFARNGKNPKITGLQLNLDTSTSFELKYSLQTYNSLYGWRRIFEGSYKDLSATAGKKWLPINFEPFEINADYLNQKFRIVVTKVSGINKIYYSDKSPFTKDSCNFYYNATTTPVLITGALRFRLMGDVADNGTDILGNQYRSLVYSQAASNVVDLNTNTWWVSKANPSKYGVENLYFDFGKKDVVDAIFLDPVTPNVNFNVYYYDGSETPGTSIDSWDSLLWKRIPKQFTAIKRQNYLFPTPIYARYIKIEFTSLQAQSYLTGDFQKPVKYKKHPQWVLDYFLSIYAYLNNETYDPFIQNQVDVSFDVLQLAFNYYKGDIIQTSTNPQDLKVVNESTDNLDQTIRNLLIKNADGVESLDVTTYAKVKKSFDPFMDHPAMRSNFDSVLSNIILNNAQSANYPVEDKMITQAGTATVSTQDRNHLISEKTVPHMYFFVDSRHGYREAIAKLPEGKAYFVGIKEIAFQRRDHKVLSNDNMYVTISGNNYNLQTNDFSFDGTVWSSR